MEDQENTLDDGSYQKDDDKTEGSDRAEKSSDQEIEKMKRSPPEFCEVGDKPKADEGTGQKPAAAAGIRKCGYCGKEFNCGKALGGHKRFHIQALKKENNKANGDGNKMTPSVSNGKPKPSCYICNKGFPSEKSLCGHMRSHPDRNWRGVHPPIIPSDKHSACSSNFDPMEQNNKDDSYFGAVSAAAPNEPGVDLSRCLPTSWRKTNKRGREFDFDAQVVAAAEILVAISRVPELHTDAKLNEDGEFARLNNGGKALFVSGDEKVSVNMDSEEEEEGSAHESEGEYCAKNMKGSLNGMNKEVTPSRLVMVKTKNKKRKKLVLKLKTRCSESEDETLLIKTLKTQQEVYQCGICDKSFSTFQALGGHRSGHSKDQKNNSAMDEGRPPDAGEASHSAMDEPPNEGEASQSGPKSRDFDLNEPPYVMEDQEIIKSINQA